MESYPIIWLCLLFTDLLSDKLFNSYIQDLHIRCCMKLMADPVNIPVPKFVDLGLSTIDALNKGTIILTLLPELECLRIFPIGSRWIIFWEKLQWLEIL